MKDARNDIVFRDETYKEKFRIKDGDSIKITVAYDGEELIRKCRFLDETHLNIGSTCFHVDEWMEKSARAGNQYEPAPNQTPKLDILYAEPGLSLQDREIPISVTALENLLGGQLEITPLNRFSALVQGKNGNGSIAVCGLKGDNLTSLHPYDAQRCKHEHRQSERADTAEMKPSILGQLADAKKAAEENHKTAGKERDTNNRHKTDISL